MLEKCASTFINVWQASEEMSYLATEVWQWQQSHTNSCSLTPSFLFYLAWIPGKGDADLKSPLSGCICHHSLNCQADATVFLKEEKTDLGLRWIPFLCRHCSSQSALKPGVSPAGCRPPLLVLHCSPWLLLLIEVEEKNLRKSVPDVSNLF